MKETHEEYMLQREFAWLALCVFLFVLFAELTHGYYVWQLHRNNPVDPKTYHAPEVIYWPEKK